MKQTVYFISGGEEETLALGRRLGELCHPGTVLALVGDLGAGKTRFVKGLVGAQGLEEKAVTSPTFVIMNLYRGKIPVAHFDLYRLEKVDLASLGYADVKGECIVVIEWADKVDESLLGDHLRITFDLTGEHSRRLMFHARGERSAELLRALNLSP
jgi:tRNA threonylcarbamoyladenosine biosynthesis protein TsaE